MSERQFDEGRWKDRLADSLVGLSAAQKPFLQRHWQAHGFPTQVSFNGQDETPFPSDDHWTLFEDARLSNRFGNAEYFAPLLAALNPVRGVLRDHPVLAKTLDRRIGDDEVQVGILNSTTLTGLSQMIVGQMAQNRSATKDGFLNTASSLNSLLLPTVSGTEPNRTDAIDVGMDIAVLYGIRTKSETVLGEGYSLVPFNSLDDYVDPAWFQEVAPEHVQWRKTEGISAIVHRFRWRPEIRNKQSFSDGAYKAPHPQFHRWIEEFSNLLAVSLGTRISRIITLEGCISRVASDLLGQHFGPNSPIKGRSISHLFSAFSEFKEANVEQIERAAALFSCRTKSDYAELLPAIYRLGEAYRRDGRFAAHDRILDLAIVFEQLFKPGTRQISKTLQNAVAELLGENDEDNADIKASIEHFYNVRSAVIHGPSDKRKKQLLKEVERAWLSGSRNARKVLLKKLE